MEIGQVVGGKYKLIRLLGEGGMGTVYEALHTVIGRRVAFKVLHADLAQKPDIATRFVREAQTATAIGSDHIVDVTDGGTTEDGAPYIVMELLEGEDLAGLLAREGALAVPRAISLMTQVCSALEAAHRRGIVHRDLKPANLFITRRGDGREQVKVLDFGIAKFRTLAQQETALTRTGTTMGTPHYMAPEQFHATKDVDPRADIYAAGVILYEMLTGRTPFQADTYESLIIQAATATPAPPSNLRPGLPPALDQVVMRAMARDVGARFGTMGELERALASLGSFEAAPSPVAAVPPTAYQQQATPQPTLDPFGTTSPPGGASSPGLIPTMATPSGGSWAAPSPAQPITMAPAARRRPGPLLIIIFAVVGTFVALGVVGVFLLLGRDDSRPTSGAYAVEPATGVTAPGSSIEEIKATCRDHLAQERWQEALAVLEPLGAASSDPEIAQMRDTAARELEAQRAWNRACVETDQGDLREVYYGCRQVAAGSRYRARGCCNGAGDRYGQARLREIEGLIEDDPSGALTAAQELGADEGLPTPIRSRAEELAERASRHVVARTVGAAHKSAPRASRGTPSVRTGSASVRGSLSKEVIRRSIRRHINQIRYCYEQQLARQPNLEGRVQIRFVIAPSGAVTTSTVAGSTMGNPAAEQCIARAVQRITFPQPEGGGVVIVTYPFMFQRASSSGGGRGSSNRPGSNPY